ncbi:cell division protein FtsZ [Helicobacter typhlonius]|uniref:cell division protein FtsZ n=1 Tax=Helicobacter typhlonius TaxID=76936 RepID=UPI002FE101DF
MNTDFNADYVDIQEVQPKHNDTLDRPEHNVRITTIGVGGGGSHMITHLSNTNPHHAVNLVAANTDKQDLYTTKAQVKMVLGEKLTGGWGAGMRPEVGEKAALETYEELKLAINGSQIAFVCAGLGGGTGTGAAPVVAKAARETGALTIAVVTKPFKSEGNKRAKFAEEGLKKLKAESDCIIVIPNERLLSIIPPNLGYKDSMRIVDDVLARAVNGMSNIILRGANEGMNMDFADTRTVLSYGGLALMGIGEAKGDEAAIEAVRRAIESPLLDNVDINGAKGVLVCFEINEDYPMSATDKAMELIHRAADEDADIFWGVYIDENAEIDSVRVTVIATGFEREIIANNENPQQPQMTQEQAMQKQAIQKLNDNFRAISPSFKEQNGLLDYELDVPTYLRAGRD